MAFGDSKLKKLVKCYWLLYEIIDFLTLNKRLDIELIHKLTLGKSSIFFLIIINLTYNVSLNYSSGFKFQSMERYTTYKWRMIHDKTYTLTKFKISPLFLRAGAHRYY